MGNWIKIFCPTCGKYLFRLKVNGIIDGLEVRCRVCKREQMINYYTEAWMDKKST